MRTYLCKLNKYFVWKSTFLKMVLFLLLQIHVHIRPRVLRTVTDCLFWSEGICPDAVVVYAFLITAIASIVVDFKGFRDCFS